MTTEKKTFNIHTWHLVSLRLLSCHLIRSQYTSSLYTYTTKESEPTNVPNHFKELIFNSSMTLLVNDVVSHYIFAESRTNRLLLNNTRLLEIYIATYRKSFGYYKSWSKILALAYSGIENLNRYFFLEKKRTLLRLGKSCSV